MGTVQGATALQGSRDVNIFEYSWQGADGERSKVQNTEGITTTARAQKGQEEKGSETQVRGPPQKGEITLAQP